MEITAKRLGIGSVLFLLVASAGMAADLRLVDATRTGDREAVRSLLKQRVNVNSPEGDGATALSWASYRDDLDTASQLIAAGANVNAANMYGITPLILACGNGSAAMVSKLLKAGANPNSAAWTGETPLMRCAHTGNVEAVKALLASGADVNAAESRQGDTALMSALEEKHDDVVKELIRHGANVDARTKNGFTPFMFAAQQGDMDAARILLEEGINVNEATPEGNTALLVASASGYEAFSIFLLEHGANPNSADRNGITALHYAIMNGLGQAISGQSMIHTNPLYVHRANMVALVKALLAHGANPNARLIAPRVIKDAGSGGFGNDMDEEWLPYTRSINARTNTGGGRVSAVGATPFLLAALSYDPDLMRILAAAGADPLLATEENVTPLMAAVGMGREREGHITYVDDQEQKALECAKIALELGNNVNAVEKTTNVTALHVAAFYGASEKIIQFLVEHGADMEAKTKAGQTALNIVSKTPLKGAVERNLVPLAYWKGSVDLLLKLGAKPVGDSVTQLSDAGADAGTVQATK